MKKNTNIITKRVTEVVKFLERKSLSVDLKLNGKILIQQEKKPSKFLVDCQFAGFFF